MEQFESPGANLCDIDGFFETKALRCGFPFFEFHQYLRENQPDLVVIAARPGVGKTSFACQIGMNVGTQFPVHMFSLEMTKEQLSQRMLSLHSGKPRGHLFSLPGPDRKRLQEQMSKYAFKIDDTNGLAINELISRTVSRHRRTPLGLVIVDYMQIVNTAGMRSKAEEVGFVAESLKSLAKTIHAPVLVLAQMNRMFDSRVADNPTAQPIMADLADSAGIEKWADVVICLHRPKDYPNTVKGYTLKNRNGVGLDFEMRFDGALTKFIDEFVEGV